MKRQKGKKTKNAKRQRTKSEGYIVTVSHSNDVFVFMYSFCIFVSFFNFYKVHIPWFCTFVLRLSRQGTSAPVFQPQAQLDSLVAAAPPLQYLEKYLLMILSEFLAKVIAIIAYIANIAHIANFADIAHIATKVSGLCSNATKSISDPRFECSSIWWVFSFI